MPASNPNRIFGSSYLIPASPILLGLTMSDVPAVMASIAQYDFLGYTLKRLPSAVSGHCARLWDRPCSVLGRLASGQTGAELDQFGLPAGAGF